MAEKLLHKGQRVYAADGTYLGRMLQCDARFMVIGNSRWKPDHWILPNEEVAAAAADVVILRSVKEAILPETSEPWSPAPDAVGNASGVDLEPLRAGMAEVEDQWIGTKAAADAGRADEERFPTRPDPSPPSEEEIASLDRERIERADAGAEKLIAAEVEDHDIGSACAPPPGTDPYGLYRVAFGTDLLAGIPRIATRATMARPIVAPHGANDARRAPAAFADSTTGHACRTRRSLERVLLGAGFSSTEAHAVAKDGFRGLVELRAERARRRRARH